MSEYKKRAGLAAAVAVLLALGLTGVATVGFPIAPSTTTTEGNLVIPLLGLVSTKQVSCSLQTGVCAFTILNNSTASLAVETCDIVVIIPSPPNVTAYNGGTNGTIGGPAASGITAGSSAVLTCSIPVAQLNLESAGSLAAGNFALKILDRWEGWPAGTMVSFGFEGNWS